MNRLLKFGLFLAVFGIVLSGWPQTMIGGTSRMALDTTAGDLTVDPEWHRDSSVALRLSTRWASVDVASLRINGIEVARLAVDEERDFLLTIPTNSRGTYTCEFRFGSESYHRTIRTTGSRMTATSASVALDTLKNRTISPIGEVLLYDTRWYVDCVRIKIEDAEGVIADGIRGEVGYPRKGLCLYRFNLSAMNIDGNVVKQETAVFKGESEEHKGIISKSAVAPTSTKPGMTAEIRCSCCGEIIQEATEIPALGYIRNVTARQLWPHKKVEVCYTLAEDIGEMVDEDAVLHLSVKDGADARTVIGDKSCAPGLHRVVWDVEADGIQLFGQSVRFTVAYGLLQYLVVDLSGGVGADSYPVTTLRDIPAEGWSDEYKTTKLVLCRINSGSYIMGDVQTDESHRTTISKPFYMGVFPVTQRQWELIEGDRPSACSYIGLRPVERVSYNRVRGSSLGSGWPTSSAVDEACFLGRLRKKSGVNSFDLPTEAQWEYACRAGTTTKYSFGDSVDGAYMWSSANSSGATQSVGTKLPNPWGLYDMHGCVWEWCLDWKVENLQYGKDPLGPNSGSYRVSRGGCWCREASLGASSVRGFGGPNYSDQGSGFRIVCGMEGSVGCSGVSEGVTIDTTSAICEGMNVGCANTLECSAIDSLKGDVEIDGATALSVRDAGSFVWQPRTKGEHVIKHLAGTNVWTRTVNVTSLVYEEPVPNPPAEDPNISISTTSKSFTKKGGKATITVTGSGTWTASASDDWIVLGAESGEVGSKNVSYQVAANAGVESRTGFIYVSGHVFTITQAGVGATLETDSAEIGMDGGVGRFTVSADAQATWRARSDVDWISVETLVGTGATEVVYHVAPLNAVSTRSGTITAAGCTFTVNQTGRSMVLSAAAVTKDYRAHDVVVAVEAFATTAWGIALDAPWLSIVDPGPGQGSGAVTLALNENPSYVDRTATALIGTETLTITQTGRPTEALSFEISPEDTTASVKGANGLVAVTATPDLPWTATSQASWLTVMPGFSSGAGNGNVVYAASPNPTMAEREGTLLIAPTPVSGLSACVHTVVQPAATATVAKASHEFAAVGDSVAVDVAVGDNVAWTIVENADWISVDGALNRIGPGAVTLAVEANPSIAGRSAEVTIAGHVFTVTQPGHGFTVMCLDYDEEPLSGCSFVFGPDDELEGYIDVTPAQDVEWIAEKDVSWIEFWENDYYETLDDDRIRGSGYGRIDFLVSDYDGADGPRTGVITIGDRKVFVTQRASDFDIDPNVTNVTGHAGMGVVTVPPSAGSDWDAIVSVPWLDILETSAGGSGGGVVRYSYSANETGAPRVGMIIIGGEEYEVRQAALQLAEVKVRSDGEGAVKVGDEVKVSGSGGRWKGSVDHGTTITLTAVPADGWRFVGWKRNGVAVGDGTPTLPVTVDADLEIVVIFERIPVYSVNGEIVREGEVRNFTAPEPVVLGGTTQLVCRGTSAFPEKGTSFSLTIAGDVAFEWDLWMTNFWVDVVQTAGGKISGVARACGDLIEVALPGWIGAGREVELTATPSAGYSLMRWTVDAESSPRQNEDVASFIRRGEDTASTRVTSPLTVSAVFGVFDDTLATAADAPTLAFRTGGDAAWLPVIDPTAEHGYSSVKSGVLGPESETWLETTVEGVGTLSFNWKADCEKDDSGAAEWDRLTVFTNGVEAARLDGQTDWRRVELPLSGAKTVIRWSFYRDDYDDPDPHFANCGWIDGVEFTK